MSYFWCRYHPVSTTATGLNAGRHEVTVKNTGDNTVFIGQINVNSSDQSFTNGFPLQPGESVVLPPSACDLGSEDPNVAAVATESGVSSVVWFANQKQ